MDIVHESLHIDQRRVTLVAVINLLLDAEFVQEQDAADAQQVFLLHAVLPVAAVELMRNGAVPLAVFGQVCIHQIEGHTPDAHLPNMGVHRAPWVGHFEHKGLIRALHHLLKRQGVEVLRLIVGDLLAIHGQRLGEIAIAIEKADGRQIHAAVASLLQVVAGQHTEATGVNLEHVRQAVFHAEIGD